ncbi:unnamed protein product [Natator depressus]
MGTVLLFSKYSVTGRTLAAGYFWQQAALHPYSHPPTMLMENPYAALARSDEESPPKVEEEKSCTPKAGRITATTPRRKHREGVVGDSLLRRTEAPIGQLDMASCEVCCLPGARIRDIMEGLSRIIWPSDYYPMLLIHEGTNDSARVWAQAETDASWR